MGTESTNWAEAKDWKAEDKVVIDNNQTYTILNDCSVGELVLNVGSKLIISEGFTVNIGYLSIYGELTNNGTIGKIEGKNNHIVIANNASLINAGTISQNSLVMNNDSKLQNKTNSTITIGAVTIQSGAVLDNLGAVVIEGASENNGAISNTGTLELRGPLLNNGNGTVENNGEIESLSGITNQSGGSITNNSSGTISGTITNSGSLENTGGTIAGAITNNSGGTVTNNGGTISGDVSGEGTYENNPIVVYSTIESDTVLDWNEDSSWENGVKPDTEISGNTAVIITLNADVKSTADLTFNKTGSKQIGLYLNGHTLDLSECRFILGNGIGNVNIYGPGNVKVKTFDPYDNGSNSNSPHILNLWDKTEFYIFESLYSSGSTVKITDKTGDCKFYLTASGENVNYGASGIEYIDINPEPYGEPKIYEVIDKGGDPFGTGREIQLNTSRVSNQTYSPIQFQYSVNISGGSWSLTVGEEERELSSTDSSPLPFIELGANEKSKNLILKCSTNINDIENGTGIIITIRTPDGTMDLAKIRWIKGEVQWTGAKDTDFSNPENWSQNETPLTDISALKNNTVVIPSGRTNYPVLESEISVKEIRIQDNASLKIEEGGLLLTEKLIISETGKVDGKNGAIKLCKVTTDSNQVEEVKLENSGWFEVGKLSFEPSAKGIIFGTENQAKTKISELVCENQGGKSLEIKNTISVESLNLSGASLDNLLSVKNSSEATGTVYLSNNSTGKYLKLATDSLVTVKTSKISISKSDTSEISDEDDFSEKGWVLGDISSYSTITSSNTLNWNDPATWEGDIPDISGEKEITITLNANVNIDGISGFFNKGNNKITLAGSGKFYYGERKAYLSQGNGTGPSLDWSKAENWIGGEVPNITGSEAVSIILNGDMEAESLIFNEEDNSEIHIYVNGNTLKLNGTTWFGNHIKTSILGQEIVTKRVPSYLHFYGDGEIYINVLEFAKKTGENNKNQVKLYDGIEIYITDHISPLDTHAEITRDSEESKFYLNASGTNVNWYSSAVKINWIDFEPIPYGPQTFYKITDDGGTPTSENGKTITFTREGDSNSVENTIKYKVQIIENDSTNEETWKLGYGDEYEVLSPSDGYDYSVKFGAGENSFQKILKASGTVDSGDGIIITFRTPDDKMDMCEIRYIQGELLWTGAISTEILEPTNWSYYKDTLTEETLTKEELTKLLTEEEAVIGSGATNYPEIASAVNVKQLTVKNGANITVAGNGSLTVSDSLIFEGNSKIESRAGKVVFTGKGTAENPSFEATYPEFSTFGTLEVASNATFVTETDLHITKSLLNKGIFQAGKVYLEPSEDTVTITGHEEDSEESAQKTKIGELFLENQSNKTLVINNAISVDTIKLSGNANINERKLTVKYDNENYLAGIIYLSKKATAQFLFLSDENLLTIKNARISVAESDLSNVNNPTGSESVFYTRGWRVLGAIPTEYTWVGNLSTDWFEKENWKEKRVPTSKEGAEVTIPSGCSNYPKLTENVNLTESGYELDSIFIESGASITLENFSLSVTTITNMGEIGSENSAINSEILENAGSINTKSCEISVIELIIKNTGKITLGNEDVYKVSKSIKIENTGIFDASNGKIIFSGKSTSYSANLASSSNFGEIEILTGSFTLNNSLSITQLIVQERASFISSSKLTVSSIDNQGNFSTETDLHITKSLLNNGIFQAGKVYLEPSEDTVTITGHEEDSEESAQKTKIGELFLENQSNKTLVINNAISVDTIKLSGNANINERKLTVKYDNENYLAGIIYLSKKATAQFLFLSDENLVTIRAASITIYESDTKNIIAEKFVEKGWRLGDPSEFIWVGKTDDWNEPTNWDYGTVPTPGKPVKIPTGRTNYPVLESDVDLIDETALTKEDSLLIETGAEINFARQKVSVTNFENLGEVKFNGGSIVSTSINNSGTVFLTGKEEISGEISELGTVIYSGTEADAKFSWGNNYKNLEIQDGFTGSFENGVIVSDSLKIGNGFEITEKQDNSKNLLEISGTGTLSNKENISITSTGSQSFNGQLKSDKALIFKCDTELFFYDITVSAGKLNIITQSDFTNAGNILAVGVEVTATGVFTNEGTIDSTSGDVNIKSARFTNGAEKEIFAKNMSIDSGTVTNAGILTVTGDFLVNATGDFTTQGKVEVGSELNIKSQNCTVANEISAGTILLEVSTFESTGKLSSTGDLSITATSITNSGKIEAQNGELETTEANILFGGNSENTFTGKLVVTTATDSENNGIIIASEFEVNATGVFTNEGTIDSTSGDVNIKSARFTNGAEKEIFAKNMSIDSGTVTNAGILTVTGDFLVNATGDFTTQGKVEVGSELNIKSQNCTVANEISAGTILLEVSTFESTGKLSSTGDLSITATSITNSGKIEAQNGELETTEANILFGENSENTFTGKLVVTTATDFENNGIIIASEFEVNATTDFENKGTIEVTSRNFSANVKNNFANNSQITVTAGRLLVNPVVNFTNAGNILAVGVEVNATGIFTNEGTIDSKDISINSPTVILAGTINAETNISISGNLYIIGESSISFGENFFVGTAEYPKDIYISALDSNNEAASVNFIPNNEIAQIQIYGNFALFNGKVSLGTELVVGKDMILLNGKTSGEKSIYKDSMTGFDLFKYHLDDRPVSCNLEAFPTEIPNNENISISHEEYKSTFTVEDEKTIFVWHNFYNNGVDLSNIKLHIPANDAATSSFAECYNATIKNCVVAANTSPGSAWLSTENCTDGTGNTNVAFSKAIFANVATISDSIIRVIFVDGNSPLDEKPEIKIENSCNEISSWVETDNFRFNISSELPEGVAFTGVYADPECTKSTDDKGDLSKFYLKYDIPTDGSTDYRWNTDATGSDPGAEESTDYSRNHKNVVPNLLFKRAIEASYAGLRDEHKNRLVSVGTGTTGAEPLYEDTIDNAPPTLIAVTLGQEQHETDSDAQHHYDSHNFIEWQFSEPVEITYNQDGLGTEILSDAENIQSTENFGKIINKESGFSVAGFGSFQSGKLTVGSKTGSGEVNAFYRKFALEAGEEAIAQKNRIRLSIAGYVDEENPVVVNGVDYKNWLGFIDSKNTIIPSGTFTMPEEYSKSIKDLAGNKGISPKNSIVTNATYSSMSQDLQTKTLYGTWDIDPPVVANYMKESFNKVYAQEILPVGDLTSDSAKSLEIHFLDNSAYNTLEEKNNLQWRTKIGWKENNVPITQTIPLDTKGGSRMSSATNQTLGGLRISSIVDSIKAFSYKNKDLDTIKSFDNTKYSQELVYENFFGNFPEMVLDIPYLKLYFSEKDTENMQNHNFQLIYQQRDSYGNLQGFVTDLAGNLLYDFVASSPDKSPPKISLSIGGVNKDSLYILFSKSIDWKDENDAPDEGKLRRIVKSLGIFESSSGTEKNTGLIDFSKGSRATVITETGKNTGIEISLTRAVSYEELKNLYIGVNSFDSEGFPDADGDMSLGDPISGLPGNYSMLYDLFENPISKDLKHCFSDFAVNALEVLYAYDGRTPENAVLGQGVYGGNQWTITDFSGNSSNSSNIISKRDISIAAKITNFSENANSQDKFSMIADISPNQNATGRDFELLTGINPRLWFLDSISHYSTQINSSNYVETDNLYSKNGKIETEISGNKNQNFTYVIPNAQENPEALEWKAGSQIQFLFKILNADGNPVMVDVNHDGKIQEDVDHPLYAVRLNDETDLTSIDLWSLNIVELLRQKGSVTILNNVINPLNQEETVVEVSTEESGNLRVEILTLDGNVIKVLQRGRTEKGIHYFKWDGKNLAGNPVARGMYFIRVVGPGIDETRKVMIVWEN